VASPNNLKHEINRNAITLNNVKKIIKKIITNAIELNKKVIAVSNTYYLNE
jgi:DNA polymerase III alpha subunit (gram-positive type)